VSISVFDHPVMGRLLGDDEAAGYFSVTAEIAAMLAFESALAAATADQGFISDEAASAISELSATFTPDIDALGEAVARDGVMVPELVRQMRARLGEPHAFSLHFGATSQDVVDTALVLRLKPLLDLLGERLERVLERLAAIDQGDGDIQLAARTRMQIAIPIHLSDRLRNWSQPLERARDDLAVIRSRVLRLQFGGAAGTLDRFDGKGDDVAERLAFLLDLALADGNWHTQRDGLVMLAEWLSRVTGALGKIGQDIVLMAQNGVDDVTLGDAGGSSAMAHKHNPVKGEILVALSRFNAVQLAAMHLALVHEQERSGSAWTLEWLVLPQMIVATAAALRNAQALMENLRFAP